MISQTKINLEKVASDPSISGYLSPEYAMEGAFLVKSDVFSFGVLILEIVSGRKKL
ncbi:putative protein kinase RLK-Pelle-DLSV family [Helianthus debilis subsp. tardiflorus]